MKYYKENIYGQIFLGLILFAAVFATGPFTYHLQVFKVQISTLMIIITLGVFLAANLKKSIIITNRLILLYLLFISALLLPTLIFNKGYDSLFYIQLQLTFILVFFLITNLIKRENDIRFQLYMLSVLMLSVGIVGGCEYLGYFNLGQVVKWDQRISATFGNPNYFAGFIIIVLPVIFSFIFVTKGPGKVLVTLSFITGFTMLFMSQARTAMAAGLSGLGISSACLFFVWGGFNVRNILKFLKTNWKLTIVLSTLPLLLIFFAAEFVPDLINRYSPEMITAGFNNRLNAWRAGISIWNSSGPSILAGNGLGSYYSLFFSYYPTDFRLITTESSFRHPHNEYVELLAEGGILSLALFLLFLSFIFFILVKSMKVKKESSLKYISAGLTGAAAAYSFHIFFSISSRVITTMLTIIFVYAFSCSIYEQLTGDNKFKITLNRTRYKIITLLIIGVVSLGIIIHSYNYFMAESCLYRGKLEWNNEKSLSWFKKGLRYQPENCYLLENIIVIYSDPKYSMDKFVEYYDRLWNSIARYRQIELVRGVACLSRGNTTDSVVYLKDFIDKQDRIGKEPRIYLLIAYLAGHEFRQAVNVVKEIVETDLYLYKRKHKGRKSKSYKLTFIPDSDEFKIVKPAGMKEGAQKGSPVEVICGYRYIIMGLFNSLGPSEHSVSEFYSKILEFMGDFYLSLDLWPQATEYYSAIHEHDVSDEVRLYLLKKYHKMYEDAVTEGHLNTQIDVLQLMVKYLQGNEQHQAYLELLNLYKKARKYEKYRSLKKRLRLV